jgi:uncharacterized damage-inducible protein DinB
LFGAAGTLPDDERRQDRGAFWQSIHGTLVHIYWADCIWLSRFDLTERPDVPQRESSLFVHDFDDLKTKRRLLDNLLVDWSDNCRKGPIEGKLKWFSGSIQRDAEAPLSVVLTHFFNHQTHHRGQAHALITAAGARTADTDLFLMPIELWPQSATTA